MKRDGQRKRKGYNSQGTIIHWLPKPLLGHIYSQPSYQKSALEWTSFLSLNRLDFLPLWLPDLPILTTAVQVSRSGSKDFCQKPEILKELRNRLPLRCALSYRGPGSTPCYLPPIQVWPEPGDLGTPSTPLLRPCAVQHHAAPPPQIFFPQSRQCGIVIRYKLKVYFLPFSNYTALW